MSVSSLGESDLSSLPTSFSDSNKTPTNLSQAQTAQRQTKPLFTAGGTQPTGAQGSGGGPLPAGNANRKASTGKLFPILSNTAMMRTPSRASNLSSSNTSSFTPLQRLLNRTSLVRGLPLNIESDLWRLMCLELSLLLICLCIHFGFNSCLLEKSTEIGVHNYSNSSNSNSSNSITPTGSSSTVGQALIHSEETGSTDSQRHSTTTGRSFSERYLPAEIAFFFAVALSLVAATVLTVPSLWSKKKVYTPSIGYMGVWLVLLVNLQILAFGRPLLAWNILPLAAILAQTKIPLTVGWLTGILTAAVILLVVLNNSLEFTDHFSVSKGSFRLCGRDAANITEYVLVEVICVYMPFLLTLGSAWHVVFRVTRDGDVAVTINILRDISESKKDRARKLLRSFSLSRCERCYEEEQRRMKEEAEATLNEEDDLEGTISLSVDGISPSHRSGRGTVKPLVPLPPAIPSCTHGSYMSAELVEALDFAIGAFECPIGNPHTGTGTLSSNRTITATGLHGSDGSSGSNLRVAAAGTHGVDNHNPLALNVPGQQTERQPEDLNVSGSDSYGEQMAIILGARIEEFTDNRQDGRLEDEQRVRDIGRNAGEGFVAQHSDDSVVNKDLIVLAVRLREGCRSTKGRKTRQEASSLGEYYTPSHAQQNDPESAALEDEEYFGYCFQRVVSQCVASQQGHIDSIKDAEATALWGLSKGINSDSYTAAASAAINIQRAVAAFNQRRITAFEKARKGSSVDGNGGGKKESSNSKRMLDHTEDLVLEEYDEAPEGQGEEKSPTKQASAPTQSSTVPLMTVDIAVMFGSGRVKYHNSGGAVRCFSETVPHAHGLCRLSANFLTTQILIDGTISAKIQLSFLTRWVDVVQIDGCSRLAPSAGDSTSESSTSVQTASSSTTSQSISSGRPCVEVHQLIDMKGDDEWLYAIHNRGGQRNSIYAFPGAAPPQGASSTVSSAGPSPHSSISSSSSSNSSKSPGTISTSGTGISIFESAMAKYFKESDPQGAVQLFQGLPELMSASDPRGNNPLVAGERLGDRRSSRSGNGLENMVCLTFSGIAQFILAGATGDEQAIFPETFLDFPTRLLYRRCTYALQTSRAHPAGGSSSLLIVPAHSPGAMLLSPGSSTCSTVSQQSQQPVLLRRFLSQQGVFVVFPWEMW